LRYNKVTLGRSVRARDVAAEDMTPPPSLVTYSASSTGLMPLCVHSKVRPHMNAPDRQGSAPHTDTEDGSYQPADDVPSESAADVDSQERHTVLVVENDEQSRRLIEQILAFSEYACLSAANGLQALDIVERACVDLVLMDLSMPGLDGYQTVERMRERPGYANTPIVAVSGYVEDAQRNLALRAGFTEYLTKPFRPKELVQLIGRLLSNTAQREDEPGVK
jgi:CheY-like chemotaxis protein